jgi:hypothetical protein
VIRLSRPLKVLACGAAWLAVSQAIAFGCIVDLTEPPTNQAPPLSFADSDVLTDSVVSSESGDEIRPEASGGMATGGGGHAADSGGSGQGGMGGSGQGGTGGAAGFAGPGGEAGAAGAAGQIGCPVVAGYAYRQRLSLQAQGSGVPEGYSVRLAFSHASLPDKNPDGSDLRIVYGDGSTCREIDRVLDVFQDANGWNGDNTTIYFKSQSAVSATSSDDQYFMYWGNTAPAAVLEDPGYVFAFWDGFESGDLASWSKTTTPNSWTVGDTQNKEGTYAARVGPCNAQTSAILAQNLSETDVVFDAFWLWEKADPIDVAQGMRARPPLTGYELNFTSFSLTASGRPEWQLAWVDAAGDWYETGAVQQSHAAEGVWTWVSTRILGTQWSVTQPVVASANLSETQTPGSVFLHCWRIDGDNALWVDDVRVRKLIEDEPAVVAGATETGPF